MCPTIQASGKEKGKTRQELDQIRAQIEDLRLCY